MAPKIGFVVLAWILACFISCNVLPGTAKKSNKKSCSSEFFSQYHASSDILGFVDACADKYGAKSTTIGKSAEGKPLRVISLGTGSNEIFVMAGMHGREWITPAATVWAMHEIMRRSSEQIDDMNNFLKHNTVHFLGLINPDGYDYSRTKSETQDRRQWRKNRRLLPCKGDRCAHGIDLNRNWGIEGKTFGFGATRPTSDVYQGKRPFSEPEIKAIRDWLLERDRGKKIEFVLDIHCCAQTILPPSYYHGESAALTAEHLEVAHKVAKAMTAVNQEQYGFREREKEFSATNSGISVDWIYGESGVGLALIVETRGNEKNRKLENIFDVDVRHIGPIGGEILAAIKTVAEIKLSNREKRSASAVVESPAIAQVEPIESVQETASYHSAADDSFDAVVEESPRVARTNLRSQQATDDTSMRSKSMAASYNTDTTSSRHFESREVIAEPELEEVEEEIAPPLIIEPISSNEEELDEPPLPPGELADEPPPPVPMDGDEDVVEVAKPQNQQSEAYIRRHNRIKDESTLLDANFAKNEKAVRESVEADDDSVSHIESFHRREVESDSSIQTTNTVGEEEDETDKEVDEEIEEILHEVALPQKSIQKNTAIAIESEIEQMENDIGEDALENGIASQEASNSKSASEDDILSDGKKMVRHDEGLVIIDEDDNEDNGEELSIANEDEAELLTKRLRNRINQLRAIRQAHSTSKWAAFKAKLRKGRWRAPVIVALALLLLWQYATRKNRERRDD